MTELAMRPERVKMHGAINNETGKIGWVLLWALGSSYTGVAYLVCDSWLYVTVCYCPRIKIR